MQTQCTVSKCSRPRKYAALGWCNTHYEHFRRYGHPTSRHRLGPQPQDMADRFWAKVEKTANCWFWRAYIDRKTGYGGFQVHRVKKEGAHRVAYMLTIGPIPESLTIDHLCRIRHCVNPSHLEAVPIGVNVRRGIDARRLSARLITSPPNECTR